MGKYQSAEDVIDALLGSRGFESNEERESFLDPSYETGLHDPFLLSDMDKAVERIVEAHKNKETIGIFGDYDIDGLTATTLLTDALGSFGFKVVSHIPNRFIEGYGMSEDGIDVLKKAGASLIITVDCGSTSVKEIDYSNSLGIDVVVTDHHEVPEVLPKSVALVNHKRADNKYPFAELAGVGVAFKLVQALQTKLDGIPAGHEKWLLDLVALGTVCDVVKLTDENRVLVRWGLEVMKRSRRVGLHALANGSKVDLSDVSSTTLGFVFGPRLNASGRLETAMRSLDLLLSTRNEEAAKYALYLEELNSERRKQQALIFEEALAQAEERKDDDVLILAGEGWAEGVVGIVASKVVDKFKKPAFVISKIDKDHAKGSARSFGDFSIVDAIRANEDLLEKGGGHKYAGGLTLKPGNIDDFRKGVNKFYKGLSLQPQAPLLIQSADIVFDDLNLVDLKLIKQLDILQPFGMGNSEPLFRLNNMRVKTRRGVGSENQHLKLELTDGKLVLGGIGFGMGDKHVKVGDIISPVVRLQSNTFNGRTTAQAQLVRL